jgi:sec-independent protein translocase protein TatA
MPGGVPCWRGRVHVPNLGFGELVIVFLIVMLIFGAGRLPQIGEGIGKAIRNLKRGLSADDDIDVTPVEKQVPKQASSRVEDAEIVDKIETK